jgi:hypothetical protein
MDKRLRHVGLALGSWSVNHIGGVFQLRPLAIGEVRHEPLWGSMFFGFEGDGFAVFFFVLGPFAGPDRGFPG